MEGIKIKIDSKQIFNYQLNMDLFGFYVKHKMKNYFVSIHHGISLNTININGDKITDFTSCGWNELLFCEKTTKDQFVFTHFFKKQIDFGNKFFINKNDELKFIGNEYFELNMLPNNPQNLYYKMESMKKLGEGDSGKPIYDKRKNLVGILSKVDDTYCYIIPVIYLLNSLEKKDNNNVYLISNYKNIKKINHLKVTNNKVYYSKMMNHINIHTYFLLEGDKNKRALIQLDCLAFKNEKYSIKKDYIKNSFVVKNNKNEFKCNSCIILFLKKSQLINIFDFLEFIFSKRTFDITINQTKYSLVFNTTD